MAADKLELDEIQGNILAGFKNEFITFLFLELSGNARKARAWLADVITDVATTTEVKDFNDGYRDARNARPGDPPKASWMNLALTQSGLRALGVDDAEIDQLPEEFLQGMRARAEKIGDTGDDEPAKWPNCLGSASIHALMIVADDDLAHRNIKIDDFLKRAVTREARLAGPQVDGMRRRDLKDHEHFDYRDGISQPAVVGFTDEPTPGQVCVKPGEFVLGYPGEPTPPGSPSVDPSNPQPSWLRNGSFLVFRRLAQDVSGFRTFVRQASSNAKMSRALFRAKLVGRYASGAPLVGANQNRNDPGLADSAVLASGTINDFAYQGDANGADVPRAAHIRKANPRDQPLAGDDDVRRRRILRRGIPFGEPFQSNAADRGYGRFPRGLCFVCYQRSIADQFEHIQTAWMNTDSHPEVEDGIDPLSSQVPGELLRHTGRCR